MSDNEEIILKNEDSDSDDDEDETEDEKINKNRVTFFQFHELGKLLDVVNGNEKKCVDILNEICMHINEPFTDVRLLAKEMSKYLDFNTHNNNNNNNNNHKKLLPSSPSKLQLKRTPSSTLSSTLASSPFKVLEKTKKWDAEDMLLLNLLYAPRRTRLHSVMKVLARIESVSHICAWTIAKNIDVF
jgi:hypothetical protein